MLEEIQHKTGMIVFKSFPKNRGHNISFVLCHKKGAFAAYVHCTYPDQPAKTVPSQEPLLFHWISKIPNDSISL